jgi:hypothetical protein
MRASNRIISFPQLNCPMPRPPLAGYGDHDGRQHRWEQNAGRSGIGPSSRIRPWHGDGARRSSRGATSGGSWVATAPSMLRRGGEQGASRAVLFFPLHNRRCGGMVSRGRPGQFFLSLPIFLCSFPMDLGPLAALMVRLRRNWWCCLVVIVLLAVCSSLRSLLLALVSLLYFLSY